MILLVTMLFGFSIGAMAVGKPDFAHKSGKVSVTTNNAIISVTGGSNVPFYHIKPLSAESSSQSATDSENEDQDGSYLVKFVSLVEFVDNNSDGKFNNNEQVPQSVMLFPGSGWSFSGFETVNDSQDNVEKINFNFTHTGTPSIDLINHINVAKGNEIKFDIGINDYTWKSSDSNAKLAIKMQIAGGDLSEGSNGLEFGNGYFSSVSTASTADGDINVKLHVENTNTFYLVYDHFSGGFLHDPIFGATVSAESPNNSTTASLELLPVLGGFLVLSAYIANSRKRNI